MANRLSDALWGVVEFVCRAIFLLTLTVCGSIMMLFWAIKYTVTGK